MSSESTETGGPGSGWTEGAGDACRGFAGMVSGSVRELVSGGLRTPVRRAFWLTVALPGLAVKLTADWLCLALDELLYSGYRRQEISRPVFVVGPPRSGTTFLHRMLAEDRSRFCASPAWEVLLAPSVVQKKLIRGLARLDAKIGSPLVRLFRWTERRILSAFAETHPGSLTDPEEDYFYLGTMGACTGWMLAFPGWRGIRAWLPGAEETSDAARRRALRFYRRCLQKQLYADGGGRTLLSKNASFSSWMDLLPDAFPDARFLVCMRDPAETMPSMLSTARQALAGACAAATDPSGMDHLLLDSMRAHYRVLADVVPGLPPERVFVVSQPELKQRLREAVRVAADRLALDFSDPFWENLDSLHTSSRSHRSRHAYDLADFGLDADALRRDCPVLESTLSATP